MACRGWGDAYAEIYEAISQLEVIDTHEHTRPFDYCDGRMDLGRLLDNSYVNRCFVGPTGEAWEAGHAYIDKVKPRAGSVSADSSRGHLFLGYNTKPVDGNGHSPFTFAQNHHLIIEDLDGYLHFVDYTVECHKEERAPAKPALHEWSEIAPQMNHIFSREHGGSTGCVL